jgi:hypothetical protein
MITACLIFLVTENGLAFFDEDALVIFGVEFMIMVMMMMECCVA